MRGFPAPGAKLSQLRVVIPVFHPSGFGSANAGLSKHFGNSRNGIGADIATPQRVEALKQAFAGALPTIVENKLTDLRRLSLGGRELVVRLNLLQERYCLNPATQRGPITSQPTRIICSDGLL